MKGHARNMMTSPVRGGELVGRITPSDVVRFMVEHVLSEPPHAS
jgi:hypothetical protein